MPVSAPLDGPRERHAFVARCVRRTQRARRALQEGDRDGANITCSLRERIGTDERSRGYAARLQTVILAVVVSATLISLLEKPYCGNSLALTTRFVPERSVSSN
jgi:hypothetical protein